MIYLLAIAASALAYCIKGGWLEKFSGWLWLRSKMPWYMQEVPYKRILPALIIFLSLVFVVPFFTALLTTLAWCFCFSSMGEEMGAVGDHQGAWGDYIDKGFGRSYGVKKAHQYGLAWGGLLALVTGFTWFVLAGAMIPSIYFVGSSAALALKGERGWAYAEPIVGACIGLAMGAWIGGY